MIQYLPSIDSIDKSQWQKLIDSSAYASFFQTFECYILYTKSEGIEPFVSGVTENGILVGIVIGYNTSTISFLSRFTTRSIIPGGFVFTLVQINLLLLKMLYMDIELMKKE